MGEQTIGDLLVYPNPSNGDISIRCPKGMSGPALLRIMDVTGRVVTLDAISLTSTLDRSVSLAALPNGSYIIELSNEQERRSARINLLH